MKTTCQMLSHLAANLVLFTTGAEDKSVLRALANSVEVGGCSTEHVEMDSTVPVTDALDALLLPWIASMDSSVRSAMHHIAAATASFYIWINISDYFKQLIVMLYS